MIRDTYAGQYISQIIIQIETPAHALRQMCCGRKLLCKRAKVDSLLATVRDHYDHRVTGLAMTGFGMLKKPANYNQSNRCTTRISALARIADRANSATDQFCLRLLDSGQWPGKRELADVVSFEKKL
jgi:hypothetical protein